MENSIIPIDTLTMLTGVKPDFTLLIEREHLSEQATLRTAYRNFTCRHCHHTIGAGEKYYSLVVAGSGRHGRMYPDRIHPECLEGWKSKC